MDFASATMDGMKFVAVDAGILPPGTSSRVVQDTLDTDFPGGDDLDAFLAGVVDQGDDHLAFLGVFDDVARHLGDGGGDDR